MSRNGFKTVITKAGCVFLSAVLLFLFCVPAGAADRSLEPVIEAAFTARRAHTAEGERLLSDSRFLETCLGTGQGDWIALAMARYGYTDATGSTVHYFDEDYSVYAEALSAKLYDMYESAGGKPGVQARDYYRMCLALTALGQDCEEITVGCTLGNPMALNRMAGLTLAYGLIALNAKDVSVPEAPAHSAGEIMNRLIEIRHDDGGWALPADKTLPSDVDVTAMVLTAFAPAVRAGNKTAGRVANAALRFLSENQRAGGDFASYGIYNAESTAQVLTALTALGIDPAKDERFIKKGCSVLDGLLRYRLPDGSFTHSYTEDPENGQASPGNYNYLATDQAAYALVALWRLRSGRRGLYDMRPDGAYPYGRVFYARVVLLLRKLRRWLLAPVLNGTV
jgi:hypothetical protein